MEVAATAEQVTLEHCFYVAGAPKLRCGWICPSCRHYSWAVLSKPIRLQSGPLTPLAVTVLESKLEDSVDSVDHHGWAVLFAGHCMVFGVL
jgi:hypothetical protein